MIFVLTTTTVTTGPITLPLAHVRRVTSSLTRDVLVPNVQTDDQ